MKTHYYNYLLKYNIFYFCFLILSIIRAINVDLVPSVFNELFLHSSRNFSIFIALNFLLSNLSSSLLKVISDVVDTLSLVSVNSIVASSAVSTLSPVPVISSICDTSSFSSEFSF